MSKGKIILISILSVLGAALLLAVGLFLYCFFSIRAVGDTGLPRLDVVMEEPAWNINKEDYIGCTVTLSGAGEEYDFTELEAGIRGRGNTTWKFYPKKPYRIKFEEKTSMFGEKKNKSWVLLAMYNDFSYIKDRIAFTLADSLGSDDFVPSYNYVELYINGKYKGLYLLTDQVDENKGRTDVKEDFTEEDIEVPFLVELDEYAPDEGDEGVDYFAIGSRYYTVKYPEADERYTDAQFEYIKSYIETVDALTAKKNVTVEELSEYIDLQSFMDFYIVQELMGQTEINFKSVYMSKEIGGKLKMGPIWDFDWSVNGPYLTKYRNVNAERFEGLCSGDNFFGRLYYGSPEFRRALSDRYLEVRDKLAEAIDRVAEEKEVLSLAVKKDKLRWHVFHFKADFEERSDEVIEWLHKRLLWMDEAFVYA